MTRLVRLRAVLALGTFLFILSLGTPAADEKKAGPGPSDAEFARMTAQTGKLIQESLQGQPDDNAVLKARTAAVLLAAVAQSGTSSKERATVRDAALQMADAIRKGRFDEARRQSATLSKLPVDANVKVAAQPLLGNQASFREAMIHFGLEANGGTGGEKKLVALGKNEKARRTKELPERELNDDLLMLAYRAAALAELSQTHKDATVQKDPKKWQRHAEETRQAALDLAEAVREKKGAAAWTALNRLNSACYGCHSDFGR